MEKISILEKTSSGDSTVERGASLSSEQMEM